MSGLEEYYEQHMENCDYCDKIAQDPNLTDAEKNKLIDQHALNDALDRYDNAFDEWKENHELTLKTL